MIRAILSNRQRPDIPPVSIEFPITSYSEIYQNLADIGIGHIAIRDCFVTELDGDYPVLKRLQETEINVDELDYLAKRLESFDRYELAQFQGAAVSQEFSDMTDFINLTFCCQGVTVVQDFTDLEAVGRSHYMNLHGGLTADELQTVDFRKVALSLLLNEDGIITPYGVVYASGLTSYGSQPHDIRTNFSLIEQAHRRLAKVVIENKDFEKLIRQYDRPVSFFYLDPPYFETESYYKNVGEDGFGREDHIRLRDALMSIEGKFLLSYNDCAFIRDLYDAPGIQIKAFTRINNIKQRYDNGAQFSEIILANYDLQERSRHEPQQLNLFSCIP